MFLFRLLPLSLFICWFSVLLFLAFSFFLWFLLLCTTIGHVEIKAASVLPTRLICKAAADESNKDQEKHHSYKDVCGLVHVFSHRSMLTCHCKFICSIRIEIFCDLLEIICIWVSWLTRIWVLFFLFFIFKFSNGRINQLFI